MLALDRLPDNTPITVTHEFPSILGNTFGQHLLNDTLYSKFLKEVIYRCLMEDIDDRISLKELSEEIGKGVAACRSARSEGLADIIQREPVDSNTAAAYSWQMFDPVTIPATGKQPVDPLPAGYLPLINIRISYLNAGGHRRLERLHLRVSPRSTVGWLKDFIANHFGAWPVQAGTMILQYADHRAPQPLSRNTDTLHQCGLLNNARLHCRRPVRSSPASPGANDDGDSEDSDDNDDDDDGHDDSDDDDDDNCPAALARVRARLQAAHHTLVEKDATIRRLRRQLDPNMSPSPSGSSVSTLVDPAGSQSPGSPHASDADDSEPSSDARSAPYVPQDSPRGFPDLGRDPALDLNFDDPEPSSDARSDPYSPGAPTPTPSPRNSPPVAQPAASPIAAPPLPIAPSPAVPPPAAAPPVAPGIIQCQGITVAGNQCKRRVNHASGFCHTHRP